MRIQRQARLVCRSFEQGTLARRFRQRVGCSDRSRLGILAPMYSSSHLPARGRVLTADDSSVMRELVSASLEACGYSVEAVDSGYAALEASRLERFDAVILDVEMPGIDGLAVGRALRGDPRTCASMIAIHTSLDEEIVRAGFDSYDVFFSKACDVRLLGESIDRMIRERRRRSEDADSPVGSTGAAEGNHGLGREPQPY